MSHRVIVVLPAYNAANTLERTLADLDRSRIDEIIVCDDASTDDTVRIAERLPVTLLRHDRNRGYGANQKTCYREALQHGADFVVMLHPDYQYDARVVPHAVGFLSLGICDVVLGNRIRTRAETLGGHMPPVKYFMNRGLTFMENIMAGQNLGEWHSGFRAYTRAVLETIPFERNSDDFVFDSQFLLQSVHFGFKVGDVPVPVRYFDEASSISLRRSVVYGLQTLGVFGKWYAHRFSPYRCPLFMASLRTAPSGSYR
jgi:glycosyltransferase involved in cell wall biosynthesis